MGATVSPSTRWPWAFVTPSGSARADAAQRQRLVEATALKRIPTPEEVAGVVAFVCSPAAGVITGATLQVTAGSHLNNLW